MWNNRHTENKIAFIRSFKKNSKHIAAQFKLVAKGIIFGWVGRRRKGDHFLTFTWMSCTAYFILIHAKLAKNAN
jgi:hypothetical protein